MEQQTTTASNSKQSKEKATPGLRRRENIEELNSGKGAARNLKTSLVPFRMLVSPNPSPIVSKKYTIPFPPDPYSVIR